MRVRLVAQLAYVARMPHLRSAQFYIFAGGAIGQPHS